jgi:hypothetical protein
MTLFSPSAFPQDKPLISEEIRSAIEAEGPAAATERFNEIYPAQKDQYTIDTDALTNLSMEYMQAGNMEAGMAVIGAATRIAEEMMSAALGGMPGGLPPSLAQEQPAGMSRREPEQEKVDVPAFDPGPARSDLSRFSGVYGDLAEPDPNRTLWVMPSCDGYLVSGANWGGAANWWLRSESDASFSYEDSFTSFRMSFSDGSMSHDLDVLTTPLQRRADLPSDWPDCMERPLR